MKVVIEYADGEYYLRQFKEGLVPESFRAPGDLDGVSVMIPDEVVMAYCHICAQHRTVERLLMMYDEQSTRIRDGGE
jgi:hypothetical protein